MRKKGGHIRWDEIKHRLEQNVQASQDGLARDDQRRAAVFRERAIQLAGRSTRGKRQSHLTRVLVFGLGGQHYAIRLDRIVQVFPSLPCTPVPGGAPGLLGIANFEGQIRSVLDLRQLLSAPESPPDPSQYILLVRSAQCVRGLRVGPIEEVQEVNLKELATPNQEVVAVCSEMIQGVTAEHLIVLNADALLGPQRLHSG